MTGKTRLMILLTAVAGLLYGSRMLLAAGARTELSDLFGGMAIGLGIGAIVTWFAERG